MIYCDKDPYYTNSQRYHKANFDPYEVPYWIWIVGNYNCVLLDKQGSYSDTRDQHWAFNTEEDRTMFMLRWS